MKDIITIKSKGSAFDDIAETPEEAKELKAKAAIMNDLLEKLEHDTPEQIGITQEQAEDLKSSNGFNQFSLVELQTMQGNFTG